MESIELSKATPELNDQLDFLIKFEFVQIFKRNKHRLYLILGFTLFTTILYFLPDSDRIIPFKGVFIILTILLWLIGLIFMLIVLAKYNNRIRWKKNWIQDAFAKKETFKVSFDDKTINFYTDNYESSIKWEMFKYYLENNNSIFLINERNTYEALFYSKNELGSETYDKLKEIVSSKLISLKEINGT